LHLTDATPSLVSGCELVIFGSPVYIGSLLIAKWLDRNAGLLVDKKVVLFIVSGTTADDEVQQQQLIGRNLGKAYQRTFRLFFLPGRCNIKKLSWKDRILIRLGAWLEKDPQKKEIMKNGFDQMDSKNLEPLIAAVHDLMEKK